MTKTNSVKIYRTGTVRINACGDSRLRGLRSRKPIGFRRWVVHDALKSVEMENFVAWLKDRFESEEVNTIEELNTQLYNYYEGDDSMGFAGVFGNVEDAKSYLAETKNNIEGMMKEGVL